MVKAKKKFDGMKPVQKQKVRPGESDALVEALVMGRKYDQAVMEKLALENRTQKLQALLAAVALDAGGKITASADALAALTLGEVEGLDVNTDENGNVSIEAVMAEDNDDDEAE